MLQNILKKVDPNIVLDEEQCRVILTDEDGWPVHTRVENSREIIKNVLSAEGTYTVCLKTDRAASGSVGLILGTQSNLELPDSEGGIGYWIGIPFWG